MPDLVINPRKCPVDKCPVGELVICSYSTIMAGELVSMALGNNW